MKGVHSRAFEAKSFTQLSNRNTYYLLQASIDDSGKSHVSLTSKTYLFRCEKSVSDSRIHMAVLRIHLVSLSCELMKTERVSIKLDTRKNILT